MKQIDGKTVKSPEELVNLVKAMKSGDEVNIHYHREGKTRTAKATLTSYKALMEEAPARKKAKPAPKKEEKPTKEAAKDFIEVGTQGDHLLPQNL